MHEKSCGALICRKAPEGYELLLIKHRRGGHWSFPKGHVEAGETEAETALREILEETGLHVQLQDGFRHSVEYSPRPQVQKEVVYFLASPQGSDTVHRQEEEVSEYQWCPLANAARHVTFQNDKKLINEAMSFLAEGK